MHFRIIFSNDVDGYYKENSKDVQMSMTVEEKSFSAALLTASRLMTTYVFWPDLFEVVSITQITPEEEDGVNYEFPVKMVPEDWCTITGIEIIDPDGWRGQEALSCDDPITREDFITRAQVSTCKMWPVPLWDER